MARAGPTIAQAALELIRARGPQHIDALVPDIVRRGLTKARDPLRAVQSALSYRTEFILDWDGRWCSTNDQLEGTIFSVHLTSLERREGIVILPDELALIERLLTPPWRAAGSGAVHLDFVHEFFDLPWPYEDDVVGHLREDVLDDVDDELAEDLTGFLRELGAPYDIDDGALITDFLEASRYRRLIDGPQGWLPDLGPDDLLGIRVRDGTIETERLTRRDVRGPHVGIVAAQIAKLARLVIGPDPSWFGPPAVTIEELVTPVVTEQPDLLHRPTPPFSELVGRGGLEVVDGLVGHRGTDWQALGLFGAESPEDAWGYRPARLIN